MTGKKKRAKLSETKLHTLIASIAGAIVIWAVVAFGIGAEIDKNIQIDSSRVRFLNENLLIDRGLVVLPLEKPAQYTLRIHGSRSEIVKATKSITIDVDLSGITESGEQNCDWSISGKPSGVTVNARFDDVSINVDNLITKELPVEVRSTADNGDCFVDSHPVKKAAPVSGAASELANVDHILIDVDNSAIEKDIIKDHFISFMDADDKVADHSQTISVLDSNGVRIDNKLEVESIVYKKKSADIIPEISERTAEGYTIEISGADNENGTAVIRNALTVGVKDNDAQTPVIKATFIPDGLSAGTQNISLDLQQTDDVFIPDGYDVFTVSADVYAKKTLEVPVNLENLSDGVSSAADVSITVSVETLDNDLSAENITAEADVSGLSAGYYSLPVTFSTPDGTRIKGDYTAYVALQ